VCAILDAATAARHHANVRVTTGIVALLVVCVLVGLAPAAYADPPDPSWIDGFWDNDDYDNVVVMVLHSLAIVEPAALDAGPVWATVALVATLEPHVTPAPIDATASPRAPPLTSPWFS
jgi:hypothetical protein